MVFSNRRDSVNVAFKLKLEGQVKKKSTEQLVCQPTPAALQGNRDFPHLCVGYIALHGTPGDFMASAHPPACIFSTWTPKTCDSCFPMF